MWIIELFNSRSKKSRHCLNCHYSILVGKYEIKLGCAKKMKIIESFPSIKATLCKDYIEN